MNRLFIFALGALLCSSPCGAQTAVANEFYPLYDCIRKLHTASPALNIDYDPEFPVLCIKRNKREIVSGRGLI